MNDALAFPIAWLALYTCFTLIRIHYRRQNARARSGGAGVRSGKDGDHATDARLLSLLLPYEMLTMALWFWSPWLAWAALPLPVWLRWLGLVLGALSLLGFIWVHESLGDNYDRDVRIHNGQTLITSGPYRWMRHPMYTAFGLLHLASFLISANGFIGATWCGGLVLLIAVRVPREERMLIAAFGDDYLRYMARTRRFWPRLRLPTARPARAPDASD